MNRWYNLTIFFWIFHEFDVFLTEKVFQETMENWADFEKKEKVLQALEELEAKTYLESNKIFTILKFKITKKTKNFIKHVQMWFREVNNDRH